jgi:hypothetical protein
MNPMHTPHKVISEESKPNHFATHHFANRLSTATQGFAHEITDWLMAGQT